MEEQIKKWTKPELIILVRSRPEEAVLGACKGGGGDSFLSHHLNCHSNYGCTSVCTNQVAS